MKKLKNLFIALLLILLVCSSLCLYFHNDKHFGKNSTPEQEKITNPQQLVGEDVGVLVGSIFDDILKEYIKGANPVYFNSIADMLIALDQDKVKGILLDEPVARNIKTQTGKIEALKPELTKDYYGFAFNKNNYAIREAFDEVIREFYKDGTMKEIDTIWFGTDESKKILPETLGENRRGIIKYTTNSGAQPFSYIKNGKIVGYEIDLINRIGKKLGYEIQLYDTDFNAFIPSIVSGKTDMGGSCLSITEERKKSVFFSEPVYNGGVVAVVKATDIAKKGNFITTFKKSAKRTFIEENRYHLILQGLNVTLITSLFSIILGTILGFIVCFMRRSENKLLLIPAKIYISIIQGTPILVLLMILFYVIFAKIEINPIAVAVFAFGLDFAAYASEMFRSGIDAVDKGQIEAAGAMGFNKFQIFTKITLPQALKHILPVYRGEVIATIKITSIVGYIAIQDLTKMSDIIRSRTYEAFFPLIATAIIYFVLAYLMASFLKVFEFKINPKHRKRIIKGVEVK